MKSLQNIIQEKLIINKNTKILDELSTTFDNVHELISALKKFFGNSIKDNEIIYHNNKYYFETGKYNRMGQEVNGYFYINFNDGGIIRCGLVKNKSRILMQIGVAAQNDFHNFKALEKFIKFENGYNFEKDNFREWLNKLSNEDYPLLKKKFNK